MMPLIDARRLARFALVAALLLLAATLASCGNSDGEGANTDTPAYTGSGDEKITIYSGRSEELIGDLVEQYEKQTGREVDVRYGETAELASTILEEGDNSPADVFFSQDGGALGALEQENLLVALPNEGVLAEVDPKYRSKTGRWVGTSGRARVIAYDTRDVGESELPDSILDFTDPKWKGRIGWAPSNASLQTFVTALRKTEGEDAARKWLEGIKNNDAKEYDGNEEVRDAIANGEIDIGFINHYYVAQAKEEEGDDYPVDVYYTPGRDIGSMVNVAGVGVLESSDKQKAAIAFSEYLLSEKGQEYFAEVEKEYPLAAGVKADPKVIPLDSVDHPDIDLTQLDDLNGTLELMRQTGVL